jgi:hypothetical protein
VVTYRIGLYSDHGTQVGSGTLHGVEHSRLVGLNVGKGLGQGQHEV